MRFLRQRHRAETHERPPSRLVHREAQTQVVLDCVLDVRGELIAQITIERVAADHREEPLHEGTASIHHGCFSPSACISNIKPMTAASRRQYTVSSFSWVCPRRVMA